MDVSRLCSFKNCKNGAVVYDDVSGRLICSACGFDQGFEDYQVNLRGISGPEGTFVRIGTSGTGSVLNRKEKKIFEAEKVIRDVTDRLGFSASKHGEVKSMAEKITEGEYGIGDWFPVLIGACAYIVMRKDDKSLPIAEVAPLIGCDIHELGRMVARILVHLNLKLPDFDIVKLYERSIRNIPSFNRVSGDKVNKMIKQGTFILQCAVKWFLTTGRRPLPMVVAVLVLVGKVNQVDAEIEDVSQKLNASVKTSKLRYKELLESLVEVSKSLPWGKDITIKNMLKHAPHVIQYMEIKSMSKPKAKNLRDTGFCMEDAIGERLMNETVYHSCGKNHSSDAYASASSDFFDSVTDFEKLKASQDLLSASYSNFFRTPRSGYRGNMQMNAYEFEFDGCGEWWRGKSELCKKLFLKELLEIDVGLDALPPSFKAGCLANQRRREKINAAKKRIRLIMDPSTNGDNGVCDVEELRYRDAVKKRKRGSEYLDWEDNIIESLLLHQVSEVHIENGHYRSLLDLSVFQSPNG